jgi:NADH:ubiquinone reductase (H+-translocating)
MTNKQIVIVGGGFAGFWAAAAARRAGEANVDIMLVSPEPTLVMRPRLYEANPETLGVDLRPPLKTLGVTFVQDSAVTITKGLALASGASLPFDRLVVAVGSAMKRPPIPGVETAFSVDTQADAVAFDRRLAFLATKLPTIRVAVIGAGFSGIELALELRDRVAAHNPQVSAEVCLIDQAIEVGSELGVGPRASIVEALATAEVKCELGVSVRSLTTTSVVFDDHEINADIVVLTTGLGAGPFTAAIAGERDHVGRILVDEFLRAPSDPRVFVTGDAASADVGDGHRTMMSCQHAMTLGRYAGQNAANDLLGLTLTPYEQLRYVTCLDLGRSGAVFTTGWEREVAMTGAEAKALKRKINTEIIYPPIHASLDDLLAASAIAPR